MSLNAMVQHMYSEAQIVLGPELRIDLRVLARGLAATAMYVDQLQS